MNNDDCNNGFFSLSPCELTLLASIIGVLIAEGIDGCQRNVLGNFLTSVAQSILTFDAQEDCINK